VSLQRIHTGPGFLGVEADAGRGEAWPRAHVMLRVARRDMARTELALSQIDGVTALHQISGDYDLVAVVEASQAERLDALIARIEGLSGVSASVASRLLPSARLSASRSFAA